MTEAERRAVIATGPVAKNLELPKRAATMVGKKDA